MAWIPAIVASCWAWWGDWQKLAAALIIIATAWTTAWPRRWAGRVTDRLDEVDYRLDKHGAPPYAPWDDSPGNGQ